MTSDMERIDHAKEALRLIDQCLLEEETALGALKRWSELNSVELEELEQAEYDSHNAQTSPNFYV